MQSVVRLNKTVLLKPLHVSSIKNLSNDDVSSWCELKMIKASKKNQSHSVKSHLLKPLSFKLFLYTVPFNLLYHVHCLQLFLVLRTFKTRRVQLYCYPDVAGSVVW